MDKKQIDELERLIGKVEDHLWHMEQRLPDNQRKRFRKKVRDEMYDCANIIVYWCHNYIQIEGS
jgi:hypothetical protein